MADRKLIFLDDKSEKQLNFEDISIPSIENTNFSEKKPIVSSSGINLKQKLQRTFYIIIFIIIVFFMLWTFFSNRMEQQRAYEKAQQNVETGQTINQKLPSLKLPSKSPPIQEKTEYVAPTPSYIGDPLTTKGKEGPTSEELIAMRKKSSSVLFAFNGNTGEPSIFNGDERTTSESDTLSQNLMAATTAKVSASHIGNRNFLISKGTFIEAVLTTAISSDVVGMVKATVTQDVYSTNGKVCLLERGTTLIGEYKAALERGQSRLFLLWTRAETPTGVIINLDSSSADELGRAGVDGHIENHWWKRFGNAFLISIWSDAMQILIDSQRNIKGDDNYISYDNSVRASQDLATEALRNEINIPPTLMKNQGEPIRVFIARDLDFSKVYRLNYSK